MELTRRLGVSNVYRATHGSSTFFYPWLLESFWRDPRKRTKPFLLDLGEANRCGLGKVGGSDRHPPKGSRPALSLPPVSPDSEWDSLET